MKHLLFLSGPFNPTGLTGSVEANMASALEAYLWFVEHGFPSVCPLLMGIFPTAARYPWEKWMVYVNEHLLPHCGILILLPGWELSRGCLAEKARAEELGLSVWIYEDFVAEYHKEQAAVRG